MIKAITTIRRVGSAREYETLAGFLESLGFESGKEWKSRSSRGKYLQAPLGKIELIDGKDEFPADLWVEVDDLDSAFAAVRKKKIKLVFEIEDTDWGGRVLVIEPAKGMRLALWQKSRPATDAVEGVLDARGMRFALVVARWNSFITERLLAGALDALRRSGCKEQDITVVRVPGSFEIPSQARTLAKTGKYDAIITLGCLIRGETTHYEHIATEVTRGIGQSAQETGVPHSYGVLTCESVEQALDRAGLKSGNKGYEAAVSAIEMVSLKRQTQGKKRKSTGRRRKGQGAGAK